MKTVGMDVGKASLDVAVEDVPGVVRSPNTTAGIGKLIRRSQDAKLDGSQTCEHGTVFAANHCTGTHLEIPASVGTVGRCKCGRLTPIVFRRHYRSLISHVGKTLLESECYADVAV